MAAAYTAAAAGYTDVITYDMGGTSTDVGADPGRRAAQCPRSWSSNTPCRSTCRWWTCTPSAPAAARSPSSTRPACCRSARNRAGADARPDLLRPRRHRADHHRRQPDPRAGSIRRSCSPWSGRCRWTRCAPSSLAKIGKPLGLDATAAAAAILRIANDKMAGAIRMVSLARGHDPRDFVLFPFGGAGPLHAAALARELAIPKLLIPVRPGITNALGCVVADARHDYVNTVNKPLPALDIESGLVHPGSADRRRPGHARARRRGDRGHAHPAFRRHAVPGPEPYPHARPAAAAR